MKIAIALIFSCSFFYASTSLAQKCDSLKVEVEIKHAAGGRSGELTFKPSSGGTWKTHLAGPTTDESFSDDKLAFKNLPSGYYDFYIIDRNKRFCVKHIKVKID